jgi:hypothetical protein
MTITDYVWISIGQITLAATFALGILVGVSLRKGQRNGDSNEGPESDDSSGNVITTLGTCRRTAGGTCSTRSPGVGERPAR